MKISDFFSVCGLGELTLHPFAVFAGQKMSPRSVEITVSGDNAQITSLYDNGLEDVLYLTRDAGQVCCRRSVANNGDGKMLTEIGLTIGNIDLGGRSEDDYFYHAENPRIYSRLTFPVDYRRTEHDAADSAFDAVAGNKWADPGVVCDRIGRSPYQPFPAILLGNFARTNGVVHGTLSQKVFFHNYFPYHAAGKLMLDVFSGFKAIAAKEFAPGEILLDEWYLGTTDKADKYDELFDEYTACLRKKLPVLYGATAINRDNLVWGSWNDGLFRDISEDLILREAEFLKKNFPTVRWIQVDDGYAVNVPPAHGLGMPYEGDAGVDGKKFPQGLRHFTDEIRRIGLRPAVWIGGFCPKYTPIYQEHPEWFIDYDYRVEESAPLDVSLPVVREYIEQALDAFFLKYGFEGMKHDFWSYAFEDSGDLLRLKERSGYEWRDWWLKEIRKRIPTDAYLQTGCDIVMGNVFLGENFTNYRYGIDIGSGDWENVKTNFLWGMTCFATHTGDMFVPNSDSIGMFPGLNDVDAKFALNYCWVTRSAVEIAGVLSSCDKNSARYRMLRKAACNPNNGQDVYTACFDYRAKADPVPSIVYFKTGHFTTLEGATGLPLRSVGLFNVTEEAQTVGFSPADLGLACGSYILYNVWDGRMLEFGGRVEFELEPHGSELWQVSRQSELELLDSDMRISGVRGRSYEKAFDGEIELVFNRRVRGVTVNGETVPAMINGNTVRFSAPQGEFTVEL